MKLTTEQDRAVRSWQRGDVCVVAGPGSGKTRVLVERLRWLIIDREVPPERVLAITFTEKAAREMRARLVSERGASAGQKLLFEAAQVSTIDAFCNRLLRENALEAGIDPGFEILEEDEGRDLLAQSVERVLDEAFVGASEAARSFLASYAPAASRSGRAGQTDLVSDLAGLVRQIRSYAGEPAMHYPAPSLDELGNALRQLAGLTRRSDLSGLADRLQAVAPDTAGEVESLLREIRQAMVGMRKAGRIKRLVALIKDDLLPACSAAACGAARRAPRDWLLGATRRILEEFSAAKDAAGRLDFDDVLAKAAEVLASDDRPEMRFEHVLVDEFQDTNPLQIRLVERLLAAHGGAPPTCFVVGDINQSIYGFRHADQNVFREYREQVAAGGGEVIHLLENFRSRSDVLEAVHRILPGGNESGIEPHRLASANRFPPKDEPSVSVQVAAHGGESSFEQECKLLAIRLKALMASLRIADRSTAEIRSRSLQWRDIAVLVRTHDRVARLAAVLRQIGVPCRAGGGQRLFHAPETAELAALLRVVRNPRDEISLATALKSPFCGIDDAALLRLKHGRQNLFEALEGERLRADLVGEDAAGRLGQFRKLLQTCRADRATVPVRILLARAVSDCGYREFLANREDGLEAAANLDRLLEWIGSRCRQGADSLDEVSAALDAAIESGVSPGGTADHGRSGQAVEILTMHAAKGLEFPVVALMSMQSEASGTPPGLLFSVEHGIGARWTDPQASSPAPDAAYRFALADMRRRDQAESHRLLYVAMTRAEEHLVLSAAFPGAPQRRHWCKALFNGLGINPKEIPSSPEEDRLAGGLRFRYRHATEPLGIASATGDGSATVGPAILRPRAPSAQADFSATVTSVAVFAECPRKYFLSRYLGLEEARQSTDAPDWAEDDENLRPDGMDASEFGTQVHEYLADRSKEAPAEVRELADKFKSHALGRRAARAEWSMKEMGFVFAVGDSLLRGAIDLLFEEGGERILVDYKTDRVPPGGMRQAARKYSSQLQLYAAGLAKSRQPADRAVVFFLRRGAPVDIDIGQEALAASAELARQFFDAQSRHEFPTRAGPHCGSCPHLEKACPVTLP